MGHVIETNDSHFEETVLKAEIPVVVDFSATWCGPCKKLEPVIHEIASDYEGRVRVVHVNVDQAPATAARFAVLSVPTVVLFHNGEVKGQVIGLVSKRSITGMIDKVL